MRFPSSRSIFSSFLTSYFASYLALDRRIWIVAATRCVNTMAFSLVMPFMAIHIQERSGKGATAGFVYLLAGIVSSAGQAFAGELSDRIGRRRIMVLALLLRTVNMTALGLAVLYRWSLPVLGALIILNGFLRAQFEPAASAAVTDYSSPANRVSAFGLQRMGINVGWAIGPALGGTLVFHHSYGLMFFVAAPVTFLAALAVRRVDDSADLRLHGRGDSFNLADIARGLGANRPFVAYLMLVFVGHIMTSQLFSTMSVFAKVELGFPEGRIGLIYTVNGLLVVLLQIPAVAFIERGGLKRALLFGPLLYTIGYVAIALSSTFPMVALSIGILTAGEVVFSPALSDMAANLADPDRIGRAFGLFGLMQSLGISLAPLVGLTIFDHLRGSHLAMWGLIAAGMAMVGVGYAMFARKYQVD